ncbi:Carbamoyl-phosphate synthase arginine-specific large chain [Venturia nashicola]|nr:Carbamoyl-phosphate synthase arginine-specific large chain [Venturia nashicola]
MILPRSLFATAPPEPRTRQSNNPTLLFSWWCTGFAFTIICVRLFGRMVRNNHLFREDKIMLLSLIPLLARMGLVHVILIWGTNNVDVSRDMTDKQIHHRMVGARLVLASRICYAMFIWMAKFTISEFLKRLTSSFWRPQYEILLRGIRIFLAVTFIAVVIATLAECQPFHHYWQVIPDPGPQCRLGYAQLFTMGVSDIITDLLLIFFPIPIVVRAKAFTIRRKISLVLLFSLSLILVALTAYRVKSVIEHRGRQQYRSVSASGEILAAAAVANAIVIGSYLRDRGVKKQKFKYNNSVSDSTERPTTRRPTVAFHSNESDEDLFKDMCYRTPALEERPEPRAPPMVASPCRTDSELSKEKDDYFQESTMDSDESDVKKSVDIPLSPMTSHTRHCSPSKKRNVSFSDVGGLLEDASSGSSTIAPSPTTIHVQDWAPTPSVPRRGSRQILSDLGGLLSPILSSHRQPSYENMRERSMMSALYATPVIEGTEPTTPSQRPRPRPESDQTLHDVGGLLDDHLHPVSSIEKPPL